jgi:hypothetical protein
MAICGFYVRSIRIDAKYIEIGWLLTSGIQEMWWKVWEGIDRPFIVVSDLLTYPPFTQRDGRCDRLAGHRS